MDICKSCGFIGEAYCPECINRDVVMKAGFTLVETPIIHSLEADLNISDINILGGNINTTVRSDRVEDANVKRLYSIWKALV